MKKILLLLALAMPLSILAQKAEYTAYEKDGLYGIWQKTEWGIAYLPPVFMWVGDYAVAWNQSIGFQPVLEGYGFRINKIPTLKVETDADAVFMASQGALPDEWTVHDISKKVFRNSEVFFGITGHPKIYSMMTVWPIRLPNGKNAIAMVFMDESRICIVE